MLKAGGQLMGERFFRRVWDEVEVPINWKSRIVMPPLKKGVTMDHDNYSRLTLMDVIGKVFSGIIRDEKDWRSFMKAR
jgi:hypothetical protein